MKNKIYFLFALCFTALFLFACSPSTPLQKHGKLSVKGTQLVDSKGKAVQLRGVTTGYSLIKRYTSRAQIKELVNDWKVSVVRLAMYTNRFEGGYLGNPGLKDDVIEAVENCRQEGAYVIVDWHINRDNNPMTGVKQSVAFFTEISKRFSKDIHVIYEICNEPNGAEVNWDNVVKPYAEQVIPAIRANSPDAVIIVGTPDWSKDLMSAAANPLSYANIMYAMHFYCAPVKNYGQALRDRTLAAIKRIPVFVSEWGSGAAEDLYDFTLYREEADAWVKFMADNRLSWCHWSLSPRKETNAMLDSSKPDLGGFKNRLSKYGTYLLGVFLAADKAEK